MNPILSICIPTVYGREDSFNKLITEINKQISELKAEEKVELIVEKDNKEISIGKKRNNMYLKCNGEYSVQIDDDDMIASDYINEVLKATDLDKDCITYIEHCNIDGQYSRSLFSVNFPKWMDLVIPVNNCVRVRTPFFKTPIKTDLCKLIKVKDMRYAEDIDFSERIYPFLKTETFINKEMYFYQYKKTDHNTRYGIK